MLSPFCGLSGDRFFQSSHLVLSSDTSLSTSLSDQLHARKLTQDFHMTVHFLVLQRISEVASTGMTHCLKAPSRAVRDLFQCKVHDLLRSCSHKAPRSWLVVYASWKKNTSSEYSIFEQLRQVQHPIIACNIGYGRP